MPVSKPSKPSKKTKPVKPAKPAPATAPLENPDDTQSAPVLPEPANPTVPPEVLLGDGEGAAFNPLALALSAAAAKHTATQWPITFAEPDAVEESAGISCPVLVIHAASWHGLFDSVPMHLRSLETAGLFEEYERKEGGQHPTGFMTGMMTSLGEIEAPAEAEKQARRHEKLVAFGRQLDAMMGPTLEQMPGAPPRIARIPTEKLPTALYLLAVNRCNREGLGVLAARLQIDVNDRDALLQRGPATSIELVVLLRLLAGDVDAKPWLTFTLGRHRYATTAGVVVREPYQFASSMQVVIVWRFRIGPHVTDCAAVPKLSEHNRQPLKAILQQLKLEVLSDPSESQAVLAEFGGWLEKAMFSTVDIHGPVLDLVMTNEGPRILEWPAPQNDEMVAVVDEPEVWRAATSSVPNQSGGPAVMGAVFGRPQVPQQDGVPHPTEIPCVRVFNLKRKQWLYVDFRDLRKHQWYGDLLERVVLPAEFRETIGRVAHSLAGRETSAADILPGRHGGIVILEQGPTGVGKTATAEALADAAQRPVYEVSAWDLLDGREEQHHRTPGFYAVGAEGHEPIARVFDRARRWNAVLLVDEADVLFSHRNVADLARSALVGRFLHLAEAFAGVLILTTNVADSIDDAVVSRCSLVISYADLNEETREKIWASFFERTEGLRYAKPFAKQLAALESNGRQIRSAVRMALLGRNKPTLDEFKIALLQTRLPRKEK